MSKTKKKFFSVLLEQQQKRLKEVKICESVMPEYILVCFSWLFLSPLLTSVPTASDHLEAIIFFASYRYILSLASIYRASRSLASIYRTTLTHASTFTSPTRRFATIILNLLFLHTKFMLPKLELIVLGSLKYTLNRCNRFKGNKTKASSTSLRLSK